MADRELVIAKGQAALERGHATRTSVKRRTPGAPGREKLLESSIVAIDNAMHLIRPLIGLLVWVPIPDKDERALRGISHELGLERKRLKRMRRP